MVVACWWRTSLRRSSSTNGVTERSAELTSKTSWAVMMALMCSRFITIALSLPSTVDGHRRTGSRIRRSRAGRPVRRMMACFPASKTWELPSESISSHARTLVVALVPFFLGPRRPTDPATGGRWDPAGSSTAGGLDLEGWGRSWWWGLMVAWSDRVGCLCWYICLRE